MTAATALTAALAMQQLGSRLTGITASAGRLIESGMFIDDFLAFIGAAHRTHRRRRAANVGGVARRTGARRPRGTGSLVPYPGSRRGRTRRRLARGRARRDRRTRRRERFRQDDAREADLPALPAGRRPSPVERRSMRAQRSRPTMCATRSPSSSRTTSSTTSRCATTSSSDGPSAPTTTRRSAPPPTAAGADSFLSSLPRRIRHAAGTRVLRRTRALDRAVAAARAGASVLPRRQLPRPRRADRIARPSGGSRPLRTDARARARALGARSSRTGSRASARPTASTCSRPAASSRAATTMRSMANDGLYAELFTLQAEAYPRWARSSAAHGAATARQGQLTFSSLD